MISKMAFVKRHFTSFLILACLVFVAYFNSLSNAFISDDIVGIPNNPAIKKVSYIFSPFFARSAIYFIAYQIGGANPLVFRIFNILFHLGTVFLIYLIGYLMTKKKKTSLVAASLFAVHPILTESVAWISGGIYTEYTFFMLLSFMLYLLSRKIQVTSNKLQVTNFLYPLSLFLFLISLSTSEKAMVLPIVLLVYELSIREVKKHWRKMLPYFFMAGVWFTIIIMVGLTERLNYLESSFHQKGVLRNPLYQIPMAVATYLRLIAWPDILTFFHSILGVSTSEYLIHLGIFLVFIISIVIFWKKNRLIFFWLSYFIITLLPTLLPFALASTIAERYVYAGTVGIVFTLSIGLSQLSQKRWYRVLISCFFIVILVLFMMRTMLRNIDWKDEETFWMTTVGVSPANPVGHLNAANIYFKRGDYPAAERELKTAIKLNPYYVNAYHALGLLYRALGKNDLAIDMFEKSLKINPNLYQACVNLSHIYFEKKDHKKALDYMKKAVSIAPNNPLLHKDLGILYLNLGEMEKAREEFKKVLELSPENKEVEEWLQKISN